MSLDQSEFTGKKKKSGNIFIPLDPEQEKQVWEINGWLIQSKPPREMWVFNRIIEFSAVNNSNMPYALTLLQ